MNTLLIILGASLGAPARYAIDQYIRRFTTKPYGTFSVNILGSFLIGLTFNSSEGVNDLLAIGFAGAFTTWSTFMLDLYLAYELRRYKDALINVGASLIFGLLAAWAGVQLVSQLQLSLKSRLQLHLDDLVTCQIKLDNQFQSQEHHLQSELQCRDIRLGRVDHQDGYINRVRQ